MATAGRAIAAPAGGWTAALLPLARRARLLAALIAGLAVLLPLRLVTHRLAPGLHALFAVSFFRLLLWGLRIRVEVEGAFAEHALIVANHISWTDILVLGGSSPARFVAKAELRDWPLLGLLARLHGTIFVRRDAPQSASRQVAALAAALARGPVILFPEGTTGDGTDVLPFRPSLFAGAAGRPVQPVSIRYRPRGDRDWAPGELAAFAWDGDKDFWPHLLHISGGPAVDCRIVAHPTMTGSTDRKVLATASREIVRGALVRPTGGTGRQ